MDLKEVILSSPPSELTHSLNEGSALNIANSSSQLNDAHIWRFIGIIHWNSSHALNPILDSICQVRNDLHGATKVIAAPLLLNDMLVDLAGCDVILTSESNVQVALVVSEVEINFSTVIENKDFTMPVNNLLACFRAYYRRHLQAFIFFRAHSLRRSHSSGIDVHVRINLDARDLEADCLE